MSDADDLVQSTVERTLARERPAQVHVLKWMFRICRNLWIDELRSRGVRQSAVTEAEVTEDPSAGMDTLMSELTFREVARAMDMLAPDQRAVLALVAVEGLSYREAAEVLEVPAGTVMSRPARARGALVDRLRDAP